MAVYQRHLFICSNQRADNKPCCADYDTEAARVYLKQRCKALGLHGTERLRINNAGCLGCCEQGPVLVIYPEAVWYTWVDKEDLDEIIEQHLQQGKLVERLLL